MSQGAESRQEAAPQRRAQEWPQLEVGAEAEAKRPSLPQAGLGESPLEEAEVLAVAAGAEAAEKAAGPEHPTAEMPQA